MADDPREEATASKKGEEAAALDKVTDQEEERELKAVDTSRIKEKMAALAARQKTALEAQRIRDKELAAVKVAAADIDVIVREFELDRKKAERELRIAGGDLKQACETLLAS